MPTENFSYVRDWRRQFETGGWWHSFELPGGRRIDGVHSVASLKSRLDAFALPEDLCGARVLDIGAWDGWFTFEMERRGAEVTAIDCWDNPRFRQIHAALHSKVDYRIMDIYEMTPALLGRFDIVMFMGVLYHLKHPLLALERVCALTTGLAVVDSFILQEEPRSGETIPNRAMMEFFENEEFGGQSDNWCAPNLQCLMAMCRTAGFARAQHLATSDYGASLSCYRKWEPVPAPAAPSPELIAALHHTTFGINFQTRYDDYIAIEFHADGELSIGDVRPAAGGYGVRPIHLSRVAEGLWRAKFKLPPGLTPGWHDVTVQVRDSAGSNALRIAVDFPESTQPAHIEGAGDGTTWRPDVVNLAKGNVLSVWVAGLPENADPVNVHVRLAGERLRVLYVEPLNTGPARQINVHVPDEVPPGELELTVNGSPPKVVRISP